ncbi:MAG: hypothetical protein KJ000_05495, partial [Pirellulaceae bacterium]|nr:hypothetical protein [Pirellulaceae bacterium]
MLTHLANPALRKSRPTRRAAKKRPSSRRLFLEPLEDRRLLTTVIKPLYLTTDGVDNDTTGYMDRVDPENVVPPDTSTSNTATLQIASAEVTHLDTTSQGRNSNGPLTVPHTTQDVSNRLMLVAISYHKDVNLPNTPSYGSQAMTLVGEDQTTDWRTRIYRLIAPNVGTANVSLTVSGTGTRGVIVSVSTFSGVDQTTPLGTPNATTGHSTSPSVDVPSVAGDLVFDVLSGETSSGTISLGDNQTLNGTEPADRGVVRLRSSREPATTTTTTMSYTFTSAKNWAIRGVAIKPASGGGGTTTATFTQDTPLASNLGLPSGQPINVISYVNIASGSMPATPNITATLKHGATTFATLTSPTYDSGAGTLTWSTTLGSNVTIPAGQSIALEVTTAQSGVGFQIQYDSATKPSKIELPTTTFINIDSLAVYDTPFSDDGNNSNDGDAITSAPIGQTVYVRAVVSDPFGKYDITSLDMEFSPAVDPVSPTRYAANTAANQAVYEFAWETTENFDPFTITATAREGFEQDVFATAQSEFLVELPSLELSKSGTFQDGDANSRPDAEETITYTFEVTNTGNVTLTNLSLSDSLLAEGDLEYVSGDSDEDGDLDVGETWVFTASYTLTQADIDAGQVDNAASVTAIDPNGGEATAEAEASVELLQVAELELSKSGEFQDAD